MIKIQRQKSRYKYVKLSGQRGKAIFGKKNVVRSISKHYDPVPLIVISLIVPGQEANNYCIDTFRRRNETYWGPRGNNPKNEYFENDGSNSQENKAGTSPKSNMRRQETPPRKGLVGGSPIVKFAPLNT